MTIEKNGKQFEIIETTRGWSVRAVGATVWLKIPRGVCRDMEEAKQYVMNSSLF